MLGYRVEIFTQIPAENVKCALCHNVLRNPQQCSNGDLFCLICIREWLERKNECPTCNSELTKEKLSHSAFVDRVVIDKLLCCCEWREQGCTWSGTLGDLQQHLHNVCMETYIACPNVDCDDEVKRKDLPHHDAICDHGLEQCDYCPQMIKRGVQCEHEDVCELKPIRCIYFPQCDTMYPRVEMGQHVQKCEWEAVACPFAGMGCSCPGYLPRRSMAGHTADPTMVATVMARLVQEIAAQKSTSHVDETRIADLREENNTLVEQLALLSKEVNILRNQQELQLAAQESSSNSTNVTFSLLKRILGSAKELAELEQCAAVGWGVGNPVDLLMNTLTDDDDDWSIHHIVWRCREESFSQRTFSVKSPKKNVRDGVQACIQIRRSDIYSPPVIKCYIWLEGYRGACDHTIMMLRHGGNSAQV